MFMEGRREEGGDGRVDGADETLLAVPALGTVEEDWRGIHDGDGEREELVGGWRC